jgi:tetratricopeptide (TPR) repeat protein
MRSLMMCANLRVILRDPTWHEAAERALELARQLGDRRTEVYLLLGIGSAYGMDDLQRNMEYLEAALPICQELDDKGTEMRLLSTMGAQFERSGDYYRLLTEYEQKRLRISREIGDRLEEGDALMFCAQIQGLYLGDYQAGLALAEESARIWEEITARLYPLLRIAQIQVTLGRYDDARATLERAYPLSERNVYDLGRAGLDLVTTILCNTLGDEDHLRTALELTAEICQMVAANLVSRQYQMAAACESAAVHLGLARCLADEAERQKHLRRALESSQTALDIYNSFGFTQIIECTGEEILFRHSLALEANGRQTEAAEYLRRAYEEMMRKHNLIPAGSPFRQTYLENIALHRDIRARYARRT